MSCLIVGTGRNRPADLTRLGPDGYLEDISETERAAGILFRLIGESAD